MNTIYNLDPHRNDMTMLRRQLAGSKKILLVFFLSSSSSFFTSICAYLLQYITKPFRNIEEYIYKEKEKNKRKKLNNEQSTEITIT